MHFEKLWSGVSTRNLLHEVSKEVDKQPNKQASME